MLRKLRPVILVIGALWVALIAVLAIRNDDDPQPTVDLDQLAEYEQASAVAWDAMNAPDRAKSCQPLATMSRDDYQRIIQISFEGEQQFSDPGLAAYAWAELLEANC